MPYPVRGELRIMPNYGGEYMHIVAVHRPILRREEREAKYPDAKGCDDRCKKQGVR
jgi:hypothetical protein